LPIRRAIAGRVVAELRVPKFSVSAAWAPFAYVAFVIDGWAGWMISLRGVRTTRAGFVLAIRVAQMMRWRSRW
jgi:hypothetical protein